MEWKQVSPTRWERPATGLEGYFISSENTAAKFCGGREHYMLLSRQTLDITDLAGIDVEAVFRRAWTQMRWVQPLLAATVDGMTKVYEVPDDAALEKWLASTFVVASDDSTPDAEVLYRRVAGVGAAPIAQATLYWVPRSAELVLRAHHHTIDGVGVLLFWHRYLSAVAAAVGDPESSATKITFGAEPARLSPALEVALGHDGLKQPATAEQAEAAMKLFGSWATSIPGVGPPSKVGAAPSGACRSTELGFSAAETTALIAACRRAGVTVTAAAQAAYVSAVTRHADPAKLRKGLYSTANQFDLRPHLAAPYDTDAHAVSVYYTPVPYRADVPAGFWAVARSLQEHYQTTFRGAGGADMLALNGHFARVLCAAAQTPEFLAAPVPSDALVSSLGVVERRVRREYGCGGDDGSEKEKKIRVRDLKMGVDVVLSMTMLFIYTFGDRLRLVYSFNDGFEDPEDIQKYLEETRTIMTEELLKPAPNGKAGQINGNAGQVNAAVLSLTIPVV
ncbi:hypothetical protein GGR52DRAFT_589493 [Hypoxylon sp. FL1284]|nr:hypothetical protein GGR52DRAFT_589493 [Hypoxylon sp. FL1284]